jgi:signal transduction histidine kinase
MKNNILEKINDSAVQLLAIQSLEELCKIIVEEAKNLVDAEYGSIYLIKKDKLERVYATVEFLNHMKPRKNGSVQKTFHGGTVAILQQENLQKVRPELIRQGINSMITIPLSYKTNSIGVLTFYSRDNESFLSDEAHILTLFGSIASLAITKAQLYDKTTKALQMRDRFISLASHELRTPLTSINGYIQLLHRRMAHNTDSIESRWVKELYIESIRMTNLVKELLDINRIKQGQLAFVFSEVSIKEVIEKAIERFQLLNPDHPITFTNTITDNNYTVIGDYDKLVEMVTGLLNNAGKFSKPHLEISVSLTATPRTLHLSINDQGKGMSKQDLAGIFEGFYKSNHAGNKDGMGVGLLLAKHIVTHHRGKIRIRSQEDKGTTVAIALPNSKI